MGPDAVRHYGPGFMKSINEMKVPIEKIVNQIRNQTEVRPVRTSKTVLTKVAEPVHRIITSELLQRVVEQEPTKRTRKPRGGQIRGAPGIDRIPAWLTDKEPLV